MAGSRQKVFCKKGILTNFTKFTGKRLCQSLYLNKVAGLRPKKTFWTFELYIWQIYFHHWWNFLCLRSATSLKKRLWHRSFPVNSFKFLGTPFYIEHLWWLLLNYAIKFHNILTKGPEQSDWTSYSLGCYDSVIYQGIKENKGKTNKDIELTWLNQLEENMLQKTFW